MVLAKKKLKQQLRSLLAVSVEAAESRKPSKAATAAASAGAEDVNQRLQSLRELLVSKNRRDNRPTRRGGRKRRRTSPGDSKPAAEAAAEGGEAAGSPAGSSKGKKRKRAGDGAAESSEQDQGSNMKGKEEEKKNKKKKAEKNKKNKRNKKRKSSQKKNGEEDKEGTKTCSSEKKAVETATIDARDENGDAGRKVYVGGIPYYSTEDDIQSFFEGCGTVSEVDCMMFPESGKFRGIAILTFKTEAAAKRAMALDGSDMGGLYLKIQPYKAAAPPPTRQRSDVFSPEIIDGYNRLYVGNLAWDITEEDLRAFFQGCSISAVRFGEDKATGEFKGYAHVDFHDGVSLAAALKLDQAELCGRPAKISCAVPTKKVVAAPKPAAVGGQRGTTVPAAAAGGGGGKKKKRQTCYECGVPGHLSSDCPQKKPAVVAAR
ncbi:unnamed protein product [Spirodela intermedia]|uniref:Uncharacterized protein n=1 Tax=Spirodela intermedia TaxID=51605 RepID=A0A7I8JZU9_SPIIN|nr:unnamed protein product [Spirodela intermedia]